MGKVFGKIMPVVCAVALSAGAGAAQDWVQDLGRSMTQDTGRPLREAHAYGPAAVVEYGRIGSDQVFELWTPIWRETQAKVRNGKMAPREGDVRLQAEWERIVRALIKDEFFFQKAELEYHSVINSNVDRIMRGNADRLRSQVTAEVRRGFERDMNEFLQQLYTEVVRDSGGMLKLNKVLEQRGLTLADWQNRLKKKAFTQTFLRYLPRFRPRDLRAKDIQLYYKEHQNEFSDLGIVKFRHIFFSNAKRGIENAQDAAVEVWELLEDGQITFSEAVKLYSDDMESSLNGGLEVEAEASDPEREVWLSDVRKALRNEEPRKLGPILESPFGFHIAVLISIGPNRKIPFSVVSKEIERKLRDNLVEKETERYFLQVENDDNVKIKYLMPSFPAHLSCEAQLGGPSRSPRVYSTAFPEVTSHRSGRP